MPKYKSPTSLPDELVLTVGKMGYQTSDSGVFPLASTSALPAVSFFFKDHFLRLKGVAAPKYKD